MARTGRVAPPACSIRPSFMTTICSATSIASSWSWVTKIVVTWTSSWRRRSHTRSSLRTLASSAPKGSSSSSTSGSTASAGRAPSLALAARQLRRVAIGEALEVDEAHQLLHALLDLLLGPLADREAEGDVVAHRHVLEGGVVLEHEADPSVLDRDTGGLLAEIRTRPESGARAQRSPGAASTCRCRSGRAGPSASRPDLDRDVVQGDEVAELLACPQPRCPSGFLSS